MTGRPPHPEDELQLEPAHPDDPLAPWEPWDDPGCRIEALGGQSGEPMAAFATDTILDVLGHGAEQTDHEVGGVLIGSFTRTPRGVMTRVEDIVIADTTEASLTHVTFTHEAWQRIHLALDQREDRLRIVGWYHTHPGFGPFLSAHDHFIHEHFFTHALHVALVMDPVQDLLAVFGWSGGSIRRLDGCYLYAEAEREQELEELLRQFRYSATPREGSRGILGFLRRR